MQGKREAVAGSRGADSLRVVRLRPASEIRPGILVAADAVAILVFVTIGLLSHHRGVSARGYARDALPFLGCWFAAAAIARLYSRPRARRLVVTWAAGVPTAVLIRALVLGRTLGGKEAAFLAVSLVTIGLLVPVTRLFARARPLAPSPRRSARRQPPPAES
jgi:hypothetical protein